jgi:hypothetical protein
MTLVANSIIQLDCNNYKADVRGHIFMKWYLIKYRDVFTFVFTKRTSDNAICADL